MNKYQKVIDYENHQAKFFGNINGIIMEVSKDIIIDDYEKEIERLNNIINELEKYCIENVKYDEVGMKILDQSYVLDKLAELKGGK